MVAYTWMDRKVVMVMVSNTQPSAFGSVLQQQKDHSCTPIPCPESIILYNKYMGGVDRGDQLRRYVLQLQDKEQKIFHLLFDVAITDSYILQKNFCPNNTIKNIKDYQLKLAMQLIGEYCSQRAGPVAIHPSTSPVPLSSENHQ